MPSIIVVQFKRIIPNTTLKQVLYIEVLVICTHLSHQTNIIFIHECRSQHSEFFIDLSEQTKRYQMPTKFFNQLKIYNEDV